MDKVSSFIHQYSSFKASEITKDDGSKTDCLIHNKWGKSHEVTASIKE